MNFPQLKFLQPIARASPTHYLGSPLPGQLDQLFDLVLKGFRFTELFVFRVRILSKSVLIGDSAEL